MSLFLTGLLSWALSSSCRAESLEQPQQQQQHIENPTREVQKQTLPLLREALHSAKERKEQLEAQKAASQKEERFDHYNMRICNAYAWTEAIEVHQVRPNALMATLEYKKCAEVRVEMSSLENFEFRLPSNLKDIVEEVGLTDYTSSVEEKVMAAFNSSNLTSDGHLNRDGFVYMQQLLNAPKAVEKGIDSSRWERQFKAADTDNDGKLSVAELADYMVFGPLKEVGPNLLGTFVVENQVGDLPNPKAMETLLLLVVTRADKPLGTYMSARFTSHAFGPEELGNVGGKAVICLMDTYKGKQGPKADQVYITYDDEINGKNFSKHVDKLEYDSVVAVGEGNYKLFAAPHTDRMVVNQFYAHPSVNYIVVRVGDTSSLAEQMGPALGFPEELVVFPDVDSIAEVGDGGASFWEMALLQGIGMILILIAVTIACFGCTEFSEDNRLSKRRLAN